MSERKVKYSNRHVTSDDGYHFDSAAEGRRYRTLCILERIGEISSLELQPKFELEPAFRDHTGQWHRAIVYKADFRYKVPTTGRSVTEDVKGAATRVFSLKHKLLLARYPGLDFRIIKASEC